MSVRILLVVAAGCGRVGFDAPPTDAPGNPDARACAGFGPWSTPVALPELDSPTGNEYGPAIASDGLALYFDSDRLNSQDIYVATRTSRTDAFGASVPVPALATSASEEIDPTITGDELDIYFWDFDSTCIEHARRGSISDPFAAPTIVFCMVAGPFVTRDGLTLYYNSALDAASEGDLYVTTRASRDVEFAPGTIIAELALGGGRGYPSVTDDGLSMYFEQNTGSSLDLMETHRTSMTSSWETPVAVDAVNSPAEDGDPGISADGTELFFESARGSGLADLYHATRECL
jgi:Tol biopolymer transport system component